MNAEDTVCSRCPGLVPQASDATRLPSLLAPLTRAGFDEQTIRRSFLDPATLVVDRVPALSWQARRDGSPLARLLSFWWLNQPAPRAGLEEVVGEAVLSLLEEKGLVRQEGEMLRPLVDLYPCRDAWVFTDHLMAETGSLDHVYELGADSYTLSRATPRRRVGSSLDLCTGSGIHAILAARHSDRAVGVDVSERALSFARVNAALNGVSDRCRFVRSDLYEAVAGETFDLVLANPPWVASPDEEMALHRGGGETGEVVTERIFRGLGDVLAPGGTAAVYVLYPVKAHSPYAERVASWVGEGWGVAVLDILDVALPWFVHGNLGAWGDWGEMLRRCVLWFDTFARHRIEMMRTAMVFVRRLPGGAPGWRVQERVPVVGRDLSEEIGGWLDALEKCHAPGWPDPAWKPALVHGARAEVDRLSGRGRYANGGADWLPPVEVEADLARWLCQADGTRTVSELRALWEASTGSGEGEGVRSSGLGAHQGGDRGPIQVLQRLTSRRIVG